MQKYSIIGRKRYICERDLFFVSCRDGGHQAIAFREDRHRPIQTGSEAEIDKKTSPEGEAALAVGTR